MWTPKFPRLASWTPRPDEVPVSAIKFACERTAAGIRVAVSVFRGSPHQREDPIATVLVTPSQAVVVDQLRAVGVEPITLSLGHVTESSVPLPTVGAVSPLIEVLEVKVSSGPPPRYHALLRNGAAKAVRSIAIEATRGDQLVMSARRTGREGAALIEVAEHHVLETPVPVARPAADGSVAVAPIDRIHIVAVTWSDGTYDGTVAGINSLVSDYGDRLGLTKVLVPMRLTGSAGAGLKASDLRAAFLGVPIEVTDAMIDETRARVPSAQGLNRDRIAVLLRVSVQAMKRVALDDLAAFESAPAGAGTFEAWLNTTTDRYVRWSERLGRYFLIGKSSRLPHSSQEP